MRIEIVTLFSIAEVIVNIIGRDLQRLVQFHKLIYFVK